MVKRNIIIVLIVVLSISSCSYDKTPEINSISSLEAVTSSPSSNEETSITKSTTSTGTETTTQRSGSSDNSDNEEKKLETETSIITTTEKNGVTEDMIIYRENVKDIDSELKADMMGKSYHVNDTISLNHLKVVYVKHYGFDGEVHEGRIIVNKLIANDISDIFNELFLVKYPIEKIIPICYYEGDDDMSISDNNTSGFNYRVIEGTDRLSRHAYGLAIDINPLVNPWVTNTAVYPPEGEKYADRTLDQMGMIKRGDPCYNAFISRGFTWGGDWTSSKDYQHFDIVLNKGD